MGKLLTKELFFKNRVLKSEIIEVSGGSVKVVELMSSDRDTFEKSVFDQSTMSIKQNIENFRARLVALTVVDENDKRLFTTEEDIKELGKMPASCLDMLFAVAQRLSGLTKEDVKDLTKNSKGQSD